MSYGIYIFVTIFLALLIIYSKNKQAEKHQNIQTYKYPPLLSIIMIVGYVVLNLLIIRSVVIDPKELIEIISEFEWQEFGGLFVTYIFMPLMILYLIKTRFILYSDRIVKKSPFGTKEMKFIDVKKIIIYREAAMTRLYSDKRMTFEAFLEDYNSLVNEVTFHCDNAVIIDK